MNIASIYFGYIDNSAIFGSDALFYTFLCVAFLGQKLSVKEGLGIFIAFSGILFILFYDISNANWLKGIICAGAALYSAISFSIIFFMTSIIVRHDSPKRVAFYQSLVGSVVSFIGAFFTISFFYENGFSFELVSWEIIRNSIILGLLYVTALHRFLRAFLYTEPVIIAVLGYTLPIFVMIFELFFKGVLLNLKDIISIILITAGCVILVHEESKRRKLHKPSKPLYKSNLDH